MLITSSTAIVPGSYDLSGRRQPRSARYRIIEGNDIVVDSSGAQMNGAPNDELPNEYSGGGAGCATAANVTIRNLKVAEVTKVAVMAENVDSLLIEHCDLSYNYRQRLQSTREREDLSDWLSYHNNEADEWLDHGAALYLKNCNEATVRPLPPVDKTARCSPNATNGLFYNNSIHFNSGIGIVLLPFRQQPGDAQPPRLECAGYSHGFTAGAGLGGHSLL